MNKRYKAITIMGEPTADGMILSGLDEGLVPIHASEVYAAIHANDHFAFFPYEIHPLVYAGRPISDGEGGYLFEVSLSLDNQTNGKGRRVIGLDDTVAQK